MTLEASAIVLILITTVMPGGEYGCNLIAAWQNAETKEWNIKQMPFQLTRICFLAVDKDAVAHWNHLPYLYHYQIASVDSAAPSV